MKQGGQGSDRRGLALHQVLLDVVGVAFEPRGIQENVLAALLYRALGRRRVVTLKEALKRMNDRQTGLLLGCHFLIYSSVI